MRRQTTIACSSWNPRPGWTGVWCRDRTIRKSARNPGWSWCCDEEAKEKSNEKSNEKPVWLIASRRAVRTFTSKCSRRSLLFSVRAAVVRSPCRTPVWACPSRRRWRSWFRPDSSWCSLTAPRVRISSGILSPGTPNRRSRSGRLSCQGRLTTNYLSSDRERRDLWEERERERKRERALKPNSGPNQAIHRKSRTLRIRTSLEFMKILRSQSECVNFDRILEHHNYAVSSKTTGLHVARKIKFNHVLLFQIVPNMHCSGWSEEQKRGRLANILLQIIAAERDCAMVTFVWRVNWVLSASNDRKIITLEQHFDENKIGIFEI